MLTPSRCIRHRLEEGLFSSFVVSLFVVIRQLTYFSFADVFLSPDRELRSLREELTRDYGLHFLACLSKWSIPKLDSLSILDLALDELGSYFNSDDDIIPLELGWGCQEGGMTHPIIPFRARIDCKGKSPMATRFKRPRDPSSVP